MREPHIIKPVRFSEISVSKSITQIDRYESASVVDAKNRNVHCWSLSGNADRIEGLSFRCGSEEEHAIFADCSEMIARMLGVVSLELDGFFFPLANACIQNVSSLRRKMLFSMRSRSAVV